MHVHVTQDHHVAFNKSRGDKKTAPLAKKSVFSIARTDDEFVRKIKTAEGLYVMVVRFLEIEKKEKRRSPR